MDPTEHLVPVRPSVSAGPRAIQVYGIVPQMRLLLLAFLTVLGCQADPCVQATAACAERVPLGADGKYSLVYRTYPLTSRNSLAHRALVVVHGSDRNADHYFSSGLAAAFLAGALEDTIVLRPRFGSN